METSSMGPLKPARPISSRQSRVVSTVILLSFISTAQAAEQDRDEITGRFTLPARAHVEVSAINGSVDIKTTDGDTALVEIERTARSRAELDCNKVVVRQVLGKLLIKSEMGCENVVVQVRHRVRLSLPRYVSLSVNGVSGPVNIGEIHGALRISGNSGQINLAQAGRVSRITGNSGTTTIDPRRFFAGGLWLIGHSGDIKLYIADESNVEVKVRGLNGTASSELPNVKFFQTGAAEYYARIGYGGPTINIVGSSGSVTLISYRE